MSERIELQDLESMQSSFAATLMQMYSDLGIQDEKGLYRFRILYADGTDLAVFYNQDTDSFVLAHRASLEADYAKPEDINEQMHILQMLNTLNMTNLRASQDSNGVKCVLLDFRKPATEITEPTLAQRLSGEYVAPRVQRHRDKLAEQKAAREESQARVLAALSVDETPVVEAYTRSLSLEPEPQVQTAEFTAPPVVEANPGAKSVDLDAWTTVQEPSSDTNEDRKPTPFWSPRVMDNADFKESA